MAEVAHFLISDDCLNGITADDLCAISQLAIEHMAANSKGALPVGTGIVCPTEEPDNQRWRFGVDFSGIESAISIPLLVVETKKGSHSILSVMERPEPSDEIKRITEKLFKDLGMI